MNIAPQWGFDDALAAGFPVPPGPPETLGAGMVVLAAGLVIRHLGRKAATAGFEVIVAEEPLERARAGGDGAAVAEGRGSANRG